jgi:hypothetical protein
MLDKEIISKINNFVAQRPRTVQEIAQLIGKNWRTAESYVQKISQEYGTIATRTFRGGTRGALKIAYWNQISKNQSSFQERLMSKIISTENKDEFSAFDIYQYVKDEDRECFLEKQESALNIKQDLTATIASAEEQVLIFSGDLSWAIAKQKNVPLMKGFEELMQKNVPIKIVGKIDLNSMKHVDKLLQLNDKYGKELIEIRHSQQPLRAFIVDNRIMRIKEKYFLKKQGEHNFLFYNITDPDWINWLQKVFWQFFSTSIDAKKRITDLKTIKEM